LLVQGRAPRGGCSRWCWAPPGPRR
jgi:hypothetical protein